jgi:hypothetical protein
MPREFAEYWNAPSEKNDKLYGCKDVMLRQLELEEIDRHLGQETIELAMDMGCGPAPTLRDLKWPYGKPEIVEADCNPGIAEHAYQLGSRNPLLPGRGNYDFVLAKRVITCIGTEEEQIEALRDLMTLPREQGGLIMLFDSFQENYDNLNLLRKVLQLPPLAHPKHNVLLSYRMQDWLAAHGWLPRPFRSNKLPSYAVWTRAYGAKLIEQDYIAYNTPLIRHIFPHLYNAVGCCPWQIWEYRT